jgi:TRAP-type mannitol/chloroaromatic compound transport system permease small subunit
LSFLLSVARGIDALNENVGKAVAWLALLMVIVQFAVVILRYVFGIGSIFLQESIIYLHAVVFMVGAGYTLLHSGHVRVDIFYREASPRQKAVVDLLGVVVFLVPVCSLIWWASWPYVASSWRVFEGSRETSGIQAVFLLKTVILGAAGHFDGNTISTDPRRNRAVASRRGGRADLTWRSRKRSSS